jgi:hypothetical protein
MLVMAGATLGLLLVSAGGWIAGVRTAVSPLSTPVRFAFPLGVPQVDRPHISISQDGRQVVQTVTDSMGVRIAMIRELGALAPMAVPGTENAVHPVFSPDGRWLTFGRDQRLWKVPVSGGPAIQLAESAFEGGSWTEDGNIIFTRSDAGLWRVNAGGGEAVQLTELDTVRGEFQHWNPVVLPGGHGVIFTSFSTPLERARVEVYDFRTRTRRVLMEGAVFGRYSPSGHLLYARGGTVFAIPFNLRKMKVRGTAVPVLNDVAWVPTDGLAGYDVGGDGTLAYLRASAWDRSSRVVWFDRTGRELTEAVAPGAWAEPRISLTDGHSHVCNPAAGVAYILQVPVVASAFVQRTCAS